MTITPTLQEAWRSLWVLRRRHSSPLWARLAVAAVFGAVLALVLMSIVGAFGNVQHPNWFWSSMPANILICICIAFCLLGALRLAETVLPAGLVERMSSVRDVPAGVLLGVLAMTGIVAGIVIGFTFIPPLFGFNAWAMFHSLPVAAAKFALFLLLVAMGNWIWWRTRIRHQAIHQAAVEGQLRMLQAQIEPHFLFNTLANVQSLMEYDPPRARAMLEAFSDYLRAGLGQLRQSDSTLGAELDMARTYLELLQIRMEERLAFSVDASADARAVRLPTLLLQPLVENAIHHGLEPKVDGGRITISAALAVQLNGELRLDIHVDDDGMGLDAPRRTLRPGTGMAMANLRARLQTRYGHGASLTLSSHAGGTRATLSLPHGEGS